MRVPRVNPKGVGVGSGLLAVLVMAAAPAFAAVSLAVSLDLPDTVRVGQAVSATITVTNASTRLEGEDSIVLTEITLTPSCAAQEPGAVCPQGSEDPGAFSVGSSVTGRVGTACAGAEFTVTVKDAATGQLAFTPDGGLITLGAASAALADRQCAIDFTVNATALPTQDSVTGKIGGNSVRTTALVDASGSVSGGGHSGFGANWRTWDVTY